MGSSLSYEEGTSGCGNNKFSHSHWISSCMNPKHRFHRTEKLHLRNEALWKVAAAACTVRTQSISSDVSKLTNHTQDFTLATVWPHYLFLTCICPITLSYIAQFVVFSVGIFLTHNQERESVTRMSIDLAGGRRDCILYLYDAEKIGV